MDFAQDLEDESDFTNTKDENAAKKNDIFEDREVWKV